MPAITKDEVYHMLSSVTDPEVPVLSILDLGIVRDVLVLEKEGQSFVKVTITPTYSGCPAMDVISINIRMALLSSGIRHIEIASQLSPAWTTDWMSGDGKRKLKEYGIAPPTKKAADTLGLFEEDTVPCPKCGSVNTELVSRFGPTACKALYKCLSCSEPFEYFKCH
jgi:ring-1,2-phenylacetyl-CoA epoxidase subunit PaaD